MNSVIAVVSESHRSAGTKPLLHFQAPLLILGCAGLIIRNGNIGAKELRIRRFDLKKVFAGCKPFDKGGIGGCGHFKQAVGFCRSEIVTASYCHAVHEWWIVRENGSEPAREQFVKETETAAHHGIMRNSQRLPGETESRLPGNRVRVKKGLLTIRERLIVRLSGGMTDRFKRSREFSKAIMGADRI